MGMTLQSSGSVYASPYSFNGEFFDEITNFLNEVGTTFSSPYTAGILLHAGLYPSRTAGIVSSMIVSGWVPFVAKHGSSSTMTGGRQLVPTDVAKTPVIAYATFTPGTKTYKCSSTFYPVELCLPF